MRRRYSSSDPVVAVGIQFIAFELHRTLYGIYRVYVCGSIIAERCWLISPLAGPGVVHRALLVIWMQQEGNKV